MSDPQTDDLIGALLGDASVGIALLDAEGRYVYLNERLAAINGVPVAEHLGRSVRDVIPHVAEVVMSFHARVMETRAPVGSVQVRGSTAGMPDRTWEASYVPAELESGAGVCAVLVDVTKREDAAAETRARVRQHAAVADIGQRGLAGTDIDELLQAACDALTRELSADLAGALEFTPERDRLVMRAGSGWPDGAVGAITARTGHASQAGYTLLHRGPVLSADVTTDTRFQVSSGMLATGARSTISTPIPGVDEPFGVLGVFACEPDHFDEDDAAFIRALANVIGAAMVRENQQSALARMGEQRGRLVAQALDVAEREQRSIADVLHDDVLQHLLFARQELASSSMDAAAIDRAGASVAEAVRLLRGVVAGLHPVTLAHAGLAAALESLAADAEGRSGLRTEVVVDAAAESAHDRLIVSLVRELLTNVAKHADARRAVVTVAPSADGVLLRVADDGAGMASEALESALSRGNLGLATARERVEAIGGSVRVSAGLDGCGVGIQIELPNS